MGRCNLFGMGVEGSRWSTEFALAFLFEAFSYIPAERLGCFGSGGGRVTDRLRIGLLASFWVPLGTLGGLAGHNSGEASCMGLGFFLRVIYRASTDHEVRGGYSTLSVSHACGFAAHCVRAGVAGLECYRDCIEFSVSVFPLRSTDELYSGFAGIQEPDSCLRCVLRTRAMLLACEFKFFLEAVSYFPCCGDYAVSRPDPWFR